MGGRRALHWQILVGMVAGLAVGLAINLGHAPLADAAAASPVLAWTFDVVARANGFVGDLFLRALRFIAVPIVLFSLIVGASSLDDLKKLGRIGGRTIAIYVTTTAVAISVGLLLANLARPGAWVSAGLRDRLAAPSGADLGGKIDAAVAPDVWGTLLAIVPTNPFRALADGEMLQVVFSALAMGIALTRLPKQKSSPILAFAGALTEMILQLVHWILRAAPIAVFCLIAKVMASMGLEVLLALAVYSTTVVVGLAVMTFGVYPLLLRVFTPVGPGRFFRAFAPAQLLAFSSSSSSATLPVTMECAERRLGASEEVVSFVVPLGATINMDGTALYQGVAALFIAQLYGIELGLGDQLTIVLTATLASIGTAGVPGVGLIMLVIVLQSVGIGEEAMRGGIAIIFGVDRLLDMCRTVTNVTGDAMVTALVAHREGALLTEAEVTSRDADPRRSRSG